MSALAPVTRRVARIVLSTIKKIGNSKGVTLKKIHDYIREEYPNSPNDIVKLNNTLQKALAFGAVSKKNGKYVLGSVVKDIIDKKGRVKTYILKYGVRKVRAKRMRSGRTTRRRSGRRRKSQRRRRGRRSRSRK